MNKFLRLIPFVLFLLFSSQSFGQVPNPAMVASFLADHNVTESEVRAKLMEKGIDIDKLTPEELPQFEGPIREAIAEIEKEKASSDSIEKAVNSKIDKVAGDAAKNIKEAVGSGKTLDEAISEEIVSEKTEIIPSSPIYGHHIFRNNSIKVYNQATDVRAPDTYQLGPKDVINVSIWGYSELSKSYEVNDKGYIKPNQMAPIFVKGITLGNARKLLRKAFSRYYNFKADEFDVNLNYSRTITINITGEAVHPGSYTLPAINTAFNALVASGGPSNIGSVREITLVRPGKSPEKMDVYEFLANPNVAQSTYLQDGDYIHIPVSKKVVAISGAIVRPFRYELRANENLTDLINYAGGFRANAYNSKIQIKRFDQGEEKLIDLNYKNAKHYSLLNGDVVKIFSIPQKYENFVEISGEVSLPGEYEIEKGWKVADLIEKGKLLKTSKQDFAFLKRQKNDGSYKFIKINLKEVLANKSSDANIPLVSKDKLVIYAQRQFVDHGKVTINGAVRSPKSIPYSFQKNIKVEDLIQMAEGLSPKATDFAFIYRKKSENSKDLEYLSLDLKEIMANPNSPSNILLEPNDVLFIPNNDTYLDKAQVVISGGVRNSGEYTYDPSLTLNKLLLLTGGLMRSADRQRVEIYRLDFESRPIKTSKIEVNLGKNGQVEGSDVLLMPFDQIRVRKLPKFEFQRNITISGEVTYPGVYAITNDNEDILTLINKAGGITNEAFLAGATLYRKKDNIGYIVLRLDEVLKDKKSKFNLVLAKGDILDIPKVKDFVTIKGATRVKEELSNKVVGQGNKINVPFHPGRKASYYVDEYAGGTNDYGRKRLISIQYANGQLKHTKNYGLFKVYPKVKKGSTILVGSTTKKKRRKKDEAVEKEPVDWGKLLGDTIAQATTIITLLLLVQRIN